MFEVKTNDSPVFRYFNKEKVLGSLMNSEPDIFEKTQRDWPKVIKLTVKDFWLKIFGASEQEKNVYYYFSTLVEHIPALLKDIPNVEYLRVKEGEEGFEINIWLGQNGVVAQTHYDESHNYYAQIYGKKKFILSPPEEYKKLNLYPKLHPGQRESQIDWNKENEEGITITAEEIILSPGDLLYIPPYWFHRVYAVGESISINVWSESSEGDVRYIIEHLPLPFEEDWSSEELSVAIKYFFNELLYQAFNSLDLLQELQKRYLSIFKKDMIECPPFIFKDLKFIDECTHQFKTGEHIPNILKELNTINNKAIQEQITLAYMELVISSLLGIQNSYCYISNFLAH
uniref:JmjC domain-containing protein n=1 Tax=Arcella intermedia TaxID=1963864 RepID=A0A6B2L6Y7_9EUKA